MTLRISGSHLAYLAASSALKSGRWVVCLAGKAALKGVEVIANHFFPQCEHCNHKTYRDSITLRNRTLHQVCLEQLKGVENELSQAVFPDCGICLEKTLNDQMTTPCNHVFHQECLDRWTAINSICPTDRRPLVRNPNAQPPERAQPDSEDLSDEALLSQNIQFGMQLEEIRGRLNEQLEHIEAGGNLGIPLLNVLQNVQLPERGQPESDRQNINNPPRPQINRENLIFFLHQQRVINQIEQEFMSHGPQRNRIVVAWTRRGHREQIMATILNNLGYASLYQKRLIFKALSPEVKRELPEFETLHLSTFDPYENEVKVQDSYPHSGEFTSHFGGSD